MPRRDPGAAPPAGGDRSAGAVIAAEDLRDFVRRAARHAGLESSTVDLFTSALVEADLRGIDTHGVVRVPAYVRGYLSGELNPRHRLRIERHAARQPLRQAQRQAAGERSPRRSLAENDPRHGRAGSRGEGEARGAAGLVETPPGHAVDAADHEDAGGRMVHGPSTR